MNVLSAWILSILGVIILGIIADLILSGRLKNFCRSVFSAAAVLVIVMPLPMVIKNGCGSIDEIFTSSVVLDDNYITAGSEYLGNRIAKGVSEMLQKDGVKGVDVEITLKEGSTTEINSVKLYLKNLVIEKDLLHINKYEYLRKKVTEYLNIGEEMIYIYE